MAVADNAPSVAAAGPATANDICYRCKLTGHRAKDCPTKKTNQQPPQHIPSTAPTTPHTAPPPTATSAASDDTKTCYRCKQSGHFASACPDKKRAREAEAMTPLQASTTHSIPTAITDTTSTEQCYRCQQIGHRASACPTKKRQKAADGEAAASGTAARASSVVTVDLSSSATVNRRCYICKSADHLSSACPNKDKPHTAATRLTPPPTRSSRPAVIKPCYRCQSTAHSTVDCPVPKHCHYCESATHLAADCPDKRTVLRQREREKEKACNRCNELGHIERECPTLPHRRVWRQEGKERGLACYVCGSAAHYAVDCTEVAALEVGMNEVERRWREGAAVSEAECERLLVSCSAALEYRGAVWLLQEMNRKAIAVTAAGWEAMERLHSVSGKDQSRIVLAPIADIKKPKQQLASHIKHHRTTQRHTTVQPHLAAVVEGVERLAAAAGGVGGGVVVATSVFALCTRLRELLGEGALTAKVSRQAVMTLVGDGRLKKAGRGIVWQPEASNGAGGERAVEGEHVSASSGVVDEKERKRRLKRAQEKKRKTARKQKLAAPQPDITSTSVPSTTAS